jgi:predicted extracellular nuclease
MKLPLAVKYNRFFLAMMLAGSLLLIGSCSTPRKREPKVKATSVVFYNVENLFDTINNQGERDFEFSPESPKKWNTERYTKKMKDISHVLMDVDTVGEPGLIGLAEIENQSVLNDLVRTRRMAPEKYQIIHEESPDYRGIDVALLYRPDIFKEITHTVIGIHFKDDPDYHTRDILYAKLLTGKHDTLHVFVNHWPSRLGGLEKSQPKRVFVASVLREQVDSLLAINPRSKIIIMGDMNDEPDNKSLFDVLKVIPGTDGTLHSLLYQASMKGKGTYYFRGNWNMLDNLVVSHDLLTAKSGWTTVPASGMVFHEKWMEYHNKKGETAPNRTYGGPNYYGGISDHFPVYFILHR